MQQNAATMKKIKLQVKWETTKKAVVLDKKI